MKVGIISDTHGYLDPLVFTHFEQCDEIWHAGDVGDLSVLESLKDFRPTLGVFGNIDNGEISQQLPEDNIFVRDGIKILLTHIAGTPPRYNGRIKKIIRSENPDLLVCGHSHILKVQNDKANNLLFINPGAAGKQGFHKVKTLLRMDIIDGRPKNLEVIELGLRGQ